MDVPLPLFYTPVNMGAEALLETEKKMRPNQMSECGFLSEDDRLIDIWNQDLDFLKKVGISCEQIADSLRGLIVEATKSEHSFKKVLGEKFEIGGFGIATNGYQDCPFLMGQKRCPVGRRDFKVTNLMTQESFCFSELGLHLIEDHSFFEGHTAYRMDPEKIVRVLDLKASNYQKNWVREWKWISGVMEDENDADLEKMLPTYAKKIVQIDEFAVAYLGIPFSDHETYVYNGKTLRDKLIHEWRERHPQTDLSNDEIKVYIEAINSKSFFRHNLDAKIENPPGKEYLFVVNKKGREKNSRAKGSLMVSHWKIEVEGIQIKENLSMTGIYTFELNQFSYNTAMIH